MMNEKSTLNWKQYFKNENMLTDSLKFKDWDQKNLEIPEKSTLIKDLTRTRNDDPFFKRESTQRNLQLLATFYCQQNKVNYQQGMLEVVVPFLLLKNKEFPLPKCYAYFNSFMNLYFPKVLESKVYGERKELAHVMSAIQFSEILLKYHCADFYNKLVNIGEFNLSMVVTQWIMTLFAKGSPIPIVFIIFDQFMQRNNANYIFYLVTALFEVKKKQIIEMIDTDIDMLLPFMNKNLKTLQTEQDVLQLFQMADIVFRKTPKSYDTIIESTSFHEKTVLSMEDIKELINLSENYLSKSIFINAQEFIQLIRPQDENKKKDDKKDINLYIINIRHEKQPKFKNYVNPKIIIKYKKFKEKYQQNQHYCIVTDSFGSMNEAIKVQEELFNAGYKYISILQGGFNELTKIQKKKDNGCIIM